MAAASLHLASTLPLLRTPPRGLPHAVSAVRPPRATRAVLRGFRLADPAAKNFLCSKNSIKQAQFTPETDATSTRAKQNSSSDESSPDGPPVLTILAGIVVFLLVLWVMGSLITWIAGLVFGAAKS